MKIDIFAHITPPKYLKTYGEKNSKVLDSVEARSVAVTDIDIRLRLTDRYPDVLQVLTIPNPPLDASNVLTGFPTPQLLPTPGVTGLPGRIHRSEEAQ
jgi:hypothetical protein